MGTRQSSASPLIWVAAGAIAGAVSCPLCCLAELAQWETQRTHGQFADFLNGIVSGVAPQAAGIVGAALGFLTGGLTGGISLVVRPLFLQVCLSIVGEGFLGMFLGANVSPASAWLRVSHGLLAGLLAALIVVACHLKTVTDLRRKRLS